MAFVRILREAINDFLANMFLVIFFFIRISCIYNCIFCVCLYLRGAIDLLVAHLFLILVKKECLTYVGLQILHIAGITFLRAEPEH